MAQTKKVHFIGVCGVGTSALAIAFHNAGFIVSGSDKGFFPPVSTELSRAGVPYYAGWHPEKMFENGAPDFVVAGGGGTGSSNPEIVAAKEKNIPVLSFAEAVGEYLVKRNSIVCAGTWGKTTSTALLSHILEHANMNPGYFVGGVMAERPAGTLRKSDWSVVEGDEYKAAIFDPQAKFFHYKPTHLLLTAVSWDHADMYPTEKSYLAAFEKLLKMIPSNGLVVYCSDNENAKEMLVGANTAVTYGKNPDATYRYENMKQSADGITFDIDYHGKKYEIKSPLLGTYNAENITGCFAMAKEIGIAPGDITDAIKTFRGMKRRLEKRYENKVTVIDDIAHSPEKAKSVLKNLREIYKGKIVVVYEPNSGNRTRESIPSYENAFVDADEVVIPRLTKLKTDDKNPQLSFEGDVLADIISKTQKNVRYVDDDAKLVEYICEKRNDGDVVAFLGSHGFRGMMEGTIKKLALV